MTTDWLEEKQETTKSLNDDAIRRLLWYRRKWSHLTEGQIKSLQKCLAKRRSYQRTAKIRVWELDCGPNGKLLFDDKNEMLLWDEGDAVYRMIWMPGNEYGHLPIADWL